jgi:hypothetical protein
LLFRFRHCNFKISLNSSPGEVGEWLKPTVC